MDGQILLGGRSSERLHSVLDDIVLAEWSKIFEVLLQIRLG